MDVKLDDKNIFGEEMSDIFVKALAIHFAYLSCFTDRVINLDS